MLYSGGDWLLALQYSILFVATQFVNKYVLSVLKFTYPTIFQGWQTLVGAVILRVLALTGKIDLVTSDISRSSIAPHIPSMMTYVVTIYSGSKALSSLPIPTFLAISNASAILPTIFQLATRKNLSQISCVKSVLFVLLTTMICWSDPYYTYTSNGYFWMFIFIISSGIKEILGALTTKLREIDKLYCNYVYSVIMLAPSSYFLGDALAARAFPFLYFYRFYVGCVLSGVFGVFLQMSAIQLAEKKLSHLSFNQFIGACKILTTTISFAFFDMTFTSSHIAWISISLILEVIPNGLVENTNEENEQSETSP
ncbi:unnamed protein product [Owenia fusiformis]|uniref:Uncharacterized protein n=1 Tax=Owenia fusiformis TaxID=6347 RepID=A0A8J1UF11_OWEFU|nr:unnamed protein product [Owenia fusiformis]